MPIDDGSEKGYSRIQRPYLGRTGDQTCCTARLVDCGQCAFTRVEPERIELSLDACKAPVLPLNDSPISGPRATVLLVSPLLRVCLFLSGGVVPDDRDDPGVDPDLQGRVEDRVEGLFGPIYPDVVTQEETHDYLLSSSLVPQGLSY